MRLPAILLALPLLLGAGPGDNEAAPVSTRNLVFLAEQRPVFLRLRIAIGPRDLETAWPDSVQAVLACLDRDGDGTVTAKEADPAVLAALVRLETGPDAATAASELAVEPKDGAVTADALAEALQPVLGPFRVQLGRLASGRTDALFDQLDRDKDGILTRLELAAIGGSVRKLDLDDNEMTTPDELEPFRTTTAAMSAAGEGDSRGRYTALPPVVELVEGESSLRPARLLLKKYDKGRGDEPGRPDGKLSRSEFAIDDESFARADTNHDDALSTEELRRYLGRAPVDLVLDLRFSPDASGQASARVGGNAEQARDVRVRQLGPGDVEFALGHVRLDIHVDDGDRALATAQRMLLRRFESADANKDGYLQGKELAPLNAAGSPLAGLTGLVDRNGDGKLYEAEVREFAARLARSARDRLVLTVSDQGRAIFGILDLDRDRRLSAREVMRTVDRVSSWDEDHDGRVSADEVPYHFLITIARGELLALSGGTAARPGAVAAAAAGSSPSAPDARGSEAGPEWFRMMDRNRDGDVSRREFLGPRNVFNRLDRDSDGLLDATEAKAAKR
jgi:Ca2+-binding EF-hand superfamily protein